MPGRCTVSLKHVKLPSNCLALAPDKLPIGRAATKFPVAVMVPAWSGSQCWVEVEAFGLEKYYHVPQGQKLLLDYHWPYLFITLDHRWFQSKVDTYRQCSG